MNFPNCKTLYHYIFHGSIFNQLVVAFPPEFVYFFLEILKWLPARKQGPIVYIENIILIDMVERGVFLSVHTAAIISVQPAQPRHSSLSSENASCEPERPGFGK